MATATGASVWSTFLPILFGGIFGTILTLAVTWWRDRSKKVDEQRRKLNWLLAELLDNHNHIEHYSLAGGRAKVRLLTDAWDVVKGDALELADDVEKSLRDAYAEVWRFNRIVEYDLVKVNVGSGMLDSSLEVKAREVRTALADSVEKLARHLGHSLPMRA